MPPGPPDHEHLLRRARPRSRRGDPRIQTHLAARSLYGYVVHALVEDFGWSRVGKFTEWASGCCCILTIARCDVEVLRGPTNRARSLGNNRAPVVFSMKSVLAIYIYSILYRFRRKAGTACVVVVSRVCIACSMGSPPHEFFGSDIIITLNSALFMRHRCNVVLPAPPPRPHNNIVMLYLPVKALLLIHVYVCVCRYIPSSCVAGPARPAARQHGSVISCAPSVSCARRLRSPSS